MNKKDLMIYRIVTALFTLIIGMGAVMYVVQNEMVRGMYTAMGFPTFIIYPLAVAKMLGLIAIWTNKSKVLKEWAYAGFFFNLTLGVAAHVNVNDGQFAGAAIALLLMLISYYYNKKVYRNVAS